MTLQWIPQEQKKIPNADETRTKIKKEKKERKKNPALLTGEKKGGGVQSNESCILGSVQGGVTQQF